MPGRFIKDVLYKFTQMPGSIFFSDQTAFIYRRIFVACCLISFLTFESFGQGKDTIILHNDQILVGRIQGASLGVITIDDNELKLQNIKLYKIKVLIVHEKFKIETIEKKYYFSKISHPPKDGWINIQSDSGREISMRVTDIFLLISVDKSFIQRMNGSVTAGFSYTKSSSIGQMNLSANVLFATKRMEYSVNASSIASLDSGKFSRDNENLALFAGYDLNATWFIAGIGQYQRNLELSIARRYVEILGIGNKLFIRDNWQLTAITGLDFTQQKSTEGISSAPQLEIPAMLKFNFYQFRHPDIQISTTQTAYFSLSEPGRVRYDGTTNFSWQLIRYFYLTVSPYANFDSKPPAGSSSNFDFGIVIGLSYKF